MSRSARSSARPGAEPTPGPEPVRSGGRPVAAGGWRRIVLGLLLGFLVGALIALVLPRDDGPRRSRSSAPRQLPPTPPDPEPTGP